MIQEAIVNLHRTDISIEQQADYLRRELNGCRSGYDFTVGIRSSKILVSIDVDPLDFFRIGQILESALNIAGIKSSFICL